MNCKVAGWLLPARQLSSIPSFSTKTPRNAERSLSDGLGWCDHVRTATDLKTPRRNELLRTALAMDGDELFVSYFPSCPPTAARRFDFAFAPDICQPITTSKPRLNLE
jgi:hypothetical protein